MRSIPGGGGDFPRNVMCSPLSGVEKDFPYDDNGHGTCVAGILGGSGEASMGKYKGMAPGCSLMSLKVSEDVVSVRRVWFTVRTERGNWII